MERPSRMLGEPGEHLRMFMGGIVVEDGVDHRTPSVLDDPL